MRSLDAEEVAEAAEVAEEEDEAFLVFALTKSSRISAIEGELCSSGGRGASFLSLVTLSQSSTRRSFSPWGRLSIDAISALVSTHPGADEDSGLGLFPDLLFSDLLL